jgi:hypothetical protein
MTQTEPMLAIDRKRQALLQRLQEVYAAATERLSQG